MDSNKKILDFFNETEKLYKNFKDAGHTHIEELSHSINNSKNKNDILIFLLNEISFNKNNLEGTAFSVFDNIYDPIKYNELFNLYIEKRFEKPNDWTEEIFRLIFKNRHKGMS
ncbi:hypothetical protein N9887_01530 [Flavobacteriaceae bacterium]|nr:hypothetical protein [Flavobacteriaceae bacterium]